jgi:branched-chain amino acid transport system permease protein
VIGAVLLERAQLEFAYRFGASRLYLLLFSAVFLIVILVLPRGIVPSVTDLVTRWRGRAGKDLAAPAEQRVTSP